ncbi:MAG TPA: hypothetical protein VGB97_02260 [Candidatus Paceibacterota bacterium]|jgi:predicted PurR-regulated permease PerM
MDEEQLTLARMQQLLEENLELAEENNQLLRKMRRMGRLRMVGWILLIILPFLLLIPVMNVLIPSTGGEDSGIFGLPTVERVQRALEALQSQEIGERL